MPSISTCPFAPDPITIDVFLADDRPDLAALYHAGRDESLRRHLGGLAPARLAGACVVLARGPRGAALGGIRVHLRRPGAPLPVELALGDRCPIGAAVERAPAPLVEACGTWIVPDQRGGGLAATLALASVAVARALGARRIVGCAHQHALELYRRFGAVADPDLGVHPYPDARYATQVFWADPWTCPEGHAEIAALVDRMRGPLDLARAA